MNESNWRERLLVDLGKAIDKAGAAEIWAALSAIAGAIHQSGRTDPGNDAFTIMYCFYRLLAGDLDEKMNGDYRK